MWVQEMEAIEKAAYGFVKLTKDDFIKLGITRNNPSTGKCEACRISSEKLTRVALNEKNKSQKKMVAILCNDCKGNNSSGRSVLKGWEEK